MTTPNYKQGNYQMHMRIKRDQIGEFLNALHNMQAEMIEQALEKSDLRQANEIITYIKEKMK